jgi:uncharacterized membrane protein YqiK
MGAFYFTVIGVIALVFLFMALINRYRRCPSDKILVIYGNKGSKTSAKCVHGGGAFVWPIIEDYAYMSLTPISIDANLTNALSRQNIRVDVPCRFTVGISTEPDSMLAAAERLLGQSAQQIQELARDILFGQLRLVIATMSIEELNSDRDKFLEAISANVEVELKKIGLRLINVNVTDIKDESGYIEALGQEAAAKAINEAKVRVAEQEKLGEIGKAEAVRETRIRTAEANAEAVKGENEAKIEIANSESNRREKEAEAQRRLAESAAASAQGRTFDQAPDKSKETEAVWVKAWGDAIDAYLNGRGDVPLRGYGRKFAQAAWDHGCDPRISVCISETESGNGQICFLPYNAWGWLGHSFSSFDEGIDKHAEYLVSFYGMPFTKESYATYCGGANTDYLWDWIWRSAETIRP